MADPNGDGKSAVATPDGRSRKKKKMKFGYYNNGDIRRKINKTEWLMTIRKACSHSTH